MIVNLLVLAFVLLMIYIWAMQGLFSGLLHLVLTILAAALALAVWEPLVMGFLIHRMPEYAWGVGLLVPFALILLLLRTVFDRGITGNVGFNQLIDLVGGGLTGLFSGLLAGGLMVIGLLFIGPSPLGYQPLASQPDGQLARHQSLWIPADRVAGSFFTMLSDHALAPLSNRTLGNLYGNLAEAAGRFRLEARPGARHTIDPQHLSVSWARPAHPDKLSLPKDLVPPPGHRLVLVTTEIQQKAFDSDGVFTVPASQIVLGYYPDETRTGERIERLSPTWYIQRNAPGRFKDTGFAYSKAGIGQETFHWAFALPEKAVPAYITIKQTRVALTGEPADANPILEPVVWVQPEPSDATAPDSSPPVAPPSGGPVAAEGLTIRISDSLPFAVDRNDLEMSNGKVAQNAQGYNAVTSFTGTVKPPSLTNLSDTLRVPSLFCPPNTTIVQLTLKINKYRELWGATQAVAQATSLNPPQLVDADADTYLPVGYAVNQGGEAFIRYTPDQPINRLAEIDLQAYGPDQQVILYYRVPRGIRLTEFRLGQHKQALNLVVPK